MPMTTETETPTAYDKRVQAMHFAADLWQSLPDEHRTNTMSAVELAYQVYEFIGAE